MIPFLLTQMSAGAAVDIVYPAEAELIAAHGSRTITVESSPRTIEVAPQHRIMTARPR